MAALTTTELTYPNGSKYLQLAVHTHPIGAVTVVDGGYLTQGRRKPVKTLEEAAKQCLDASMNHHANEIQKLRKMLNAVLQTK